MAAPGVVELSDEDVFGAPGELSDDEVFGGAPAEAEKRPVGFVEGAKRFGAKALGEAGKRAGLALSAPAVGLDWAANLFRDEPRYPLGDLAFSGLVDPSQRNIENNALRPDEELTGAGKAGAATGALAGAIPDILMGGGLLKAGPDLAVRAGAPVAETVAQLLAAGVVGSQPLAQTQALTTYDDLTAAGVDPGTAAKAALGQFATDTVTMATPIGAAGNVAKRAASGAAAGVTGGVAADIAANQALGSAGYTQQQRDLTDPVARATEGGVGALMAMLLGSRAPRTQSRAGMGYDVPPPTAEQVLADAIIRPTKPVGDVVNESAGVREQPERKQQQARRKDAATAFNEGGPVTRREDVLATEDGLYPLRNEFARDKTGTAVETEELARQREVERLRNEGVDRKAFDVASAQRERKQGAQDRSNIVDAQSGEPVDVRDLREARAGGTTTREGTEALRPETFTFMDAKIKDGAMIQGEQVEVVEPGLFVPKPGGKGELPASKVRLADGTEVVVENDRLSTRSRPKNPRYAQDIAATTYAPPKGVGLGEQQPKPRTAGQRITTTESPKVYVGPERRAAPEQPKQPREGADVTDLAFDRVRHDRRVADTPGTNLTVQGRPRPHPLNRLDDPRAPENRRLPSPDSEQPGGAWRGGRRETYDQRNDRRRAENVQRYSREDLGNTNPSATERRQQSQRQARMAQYDREFDEAVGRPAPIRKELADELEGMARNAGWAERGGQLTRTPDPNDPSNEIIGRTKWVPKEDWWQGRAGGLNEKQTAEAVRKALAGEPLSKNETRAIDYMIERAEERLAANEAAAQAGLRQDDVPDVEAAARAAEKDPDAFEDAAMRFQDDDAGFNEAVRRILNDEPSTQDRQRGENSARQEARPEAELRGETEAEIRAREQAAADSDARAENDAVAAENKAKADRERDDFGLTGSDRAADANPNQKGMFDYGVRENEGKGSDAAKEPDPGDMDRAGGVSRQEIPISREEADALDKHGPATSGVFRRGGPDVTGMEGWFFDPSRVSSWRNATFADIAKRIMRRGNSSAGTLQGGIPIKPLVDAIGKAFRWATGDAQRWSDEARGFWKAVRNVRDAAMDSKEHPVVRLARAFFESSIGDLRGILRNYNSKTANWVLDQFAAEAGGKGATGRTFHDAVALWTNSRLNRLGRVMGDITNDADLTAIANLARNPGRIQAGGGRSHVAAREIRKLLDEALVYMREAGVDVGEVPNGYFPREYDLRMVQRQQAQFKTAAAQAYRELGLGSKDAAESAEQLLNSLLFGDGNTIFKPERGTPAAPFLKGRVFGKQVDSESHPLHKFLVSDPSIAIPQYLQRVARRAETTRRFGNNFEKWAEIKRKMIDEGAGEAVDDVENFVATAAGMRNPNVSQGAIKVAGFARMWGALMFLEKATLSSLSEFVTPAIRSGNGGDVARSLKTTVQDLIRKGDSKRLREFGEDMGLLAGHFVDHFNSARFAGGEPVGALQTKVLDSFFKRTGLTRWTEATRVASIGVGQTFIRRLAKDMQGNKGKLTRRYLAELGVPDAQAKAFADFVLAKNDGHLTGADVTGPMGELYRTAIQRFLNQSIMAPEVITRPKWASSPLGSVVAQLQSFNYAFYEHVLKRSARLAKDAALNKEGYSKQEQLQMLAPTMMLPLLVGVAAAVGEGRDALLGDPQKRREETFGDKAIKAVSRGTPIAPLDPWLNLITGARYNSSAAQRMSGPVLGSVFDGTDALLRYAFNDNSKTNAAERQLSKAAYDLLIEPTTNLILPGVPMMPMIAKAAATQVVGSGAVRESFMTATAGEKKQPKQQRAKRPTMNPL